MNINFLAETETFLAEIGKTFADVKFIGDAEIELDIEQFRAMARGMNYYNGYGSNFVPESLKLIFKDNTLMERFVYDGSEKWKYVVNNVSQAVKYPGTLKAYPARGNRSVKEWITPE